MIDFIALLWYFLLAQPATGILRLVPWHLLAVLGVLGVLSAYGLHFLVGTVFRFYRRKERSARWIAWPTLAVFLVSVLALLGTYLLGGRAGPLVHANLSDGVTASLGRLLLEPAFQSPTLATQSADTVSKEAIKGALRASSELDYRNQLVTRLVPPSQLAPQPDTPGGPRGPDVLVQVGLRLVTASQSGWFDTFSRSDSKPDAAAEPFFLPGFLAGLVDELPDGTVLPRVDWEHVAGTRFVEGVLRPVMVESVSTVATVLAVAVLLLDALYLLLMRRLKRIGQPRQAKAAASPRLAAGTPLAGGKAASPAPVPSAAPPAAPPAPPAPPAAAPSSTAGAPPAASDRKPVA